MKTALYNKKCEFCYVLYYFFKKKINNDKLSDHLITNVFIKNNCNCFDKILVNESGKKIKDDSFCNIPTNKSIQTSKIIK